MRLVKLLWSHHWIMRSVVWLLACWLCLLYRTLRPVYIQRHYEQRAWAAHTPIVLAGWHGRMLYFLHLYRQQHFTMLVSQSRDGDFISDVLQRFGVHTTRGSSSRGGAQALLTMIRYIQDGGHVAITPDGPRGPRYIVKSGVLAVAQQTGAAIVPVTYNARWKKVFRSWDAFLMPLPFSRIVVVYGAPIYVPTEASHALLQTKRQELEMCLRQITAMADQYFGASSA